MGYKSHAQRKAVHAHKADGGKGHPDKKGSPAKNKNNDSIAASNAWKDFKKSYMDRTHKFKGTPYEKPLSSKDNLREYNVEKNEFYYDTNKKKMRLIPTDDAERKDKSGIQSWQLAPDMRSPLDHKPMSGRSHIHRKSGRGVAYEGDASFEKFKKEGGAVQPKGKAYESRDAYLKDSSRKEPHKKSPLQMVGVQSPLNKISGPCKAAAKKKFKVWPSAYASGWGVRCTKAGGPSNYGGGKKK